MKYLYDLIKLNVVIIILAILVAFAMQANASVKTDRYKTAIVQKLTEKLRVDLSDQTVQVKLNDVRDNELSKSRAAFDGSALAVVTKDKTELPFQFSAKVDLSRQSIEDITYQFVEDEANFAPSLAESNLMQELMTKISKDYDTTNIVISIDGFDAAQLTSSETKYEGIGEVRIGDFEWRKIKFNVVLDAQAKAATRVLYEVQK
jgi:hypothetical protein